LLDFILSNFRLLHINYNNEFWIKRSGRKNKTKF